MTDNDQVKYLIQGNALDGVALIHGNLEDIKASFPFYISVLVKINRSIPLSNKSAIFKNLNNSFKLIPEDYWHGIFVKLPIIKPFPTYTYKDLSL